MLVLNITIVIIIIYKFYTYGIKIEYIIMRIFNVILLL